MLGGVVSWPSTATLLLRPPKRCGLARGSSAQQVPSEQGLHGAATICDHECQDAPLYDPVDHSVWVEEHLPVDLDAQGKQLFWVAAPFRHGGQLLCSGQ